jgi:uncharacterized membrane protein
MVSSDDQTSLQAIVRDVAMAEVDLDAAKAVQAKASEAAASIVADLPVGRAAAMRVTQFALPLPPPDLLARYEQQVPGLRKDIIDDWKTERAHRRGMEKSTAERDHEIAREKVRLERVRLRNMLIVALAGLAAIGVVGALGHTVPAGVIAALEGVGAWAFFRRPRDPGAGGE